MATSNNQDGVTIKISKTEDGEATLQMTTGNNGMNSEKSKNDDFLQSQLKALSNRSVTVFGKQITYREIIFILAAFVLGVTGFGLMITVIFSDQALAYERKMITCTDFDCYKSASEVQRKIDKTNYSPCTNFYQYACGQWIQNNPPPKRGTVRERTILTEMGAENLKRLDDAIVGAVDHLRNVDWAYEVKLQKMYKTCLNQYQTSLNYANNNPILDQIKKFGGWYLLDPDGFDDDWKPGHAEILGRDNFITAFFNYNIEPWGPKPETYKISIREDTGLVLPYYRWDNPDQNYEVAYQDLLTNVAKLLARDAGVNDAELQSRIDEFVTDVIALERAIAEVHRENQDEFFGSSYKLKKLYFMTADFGSDFDWEEYFNVTFVDSKIPITWNTEVILRTPKTLMAVSTILSTYSIATSQRINNYLVWRLIYSWLGDMSFEFNQLLLGWQAKLSGRTTAVEYKPSWTSCMEIAQRFMIEALDGVYARRHFRNRDKEEINYISESIRKSVLKEVGNLDWMDEKTRKFASEKVARVVEKMGVPDFMSSELSAETMLDFSYRNVNMSATDHFQNVQQLRQHSRREMCEIYSFGRDPLSDWRKIPIYSILFDYFQQWNELIVTAGTLQFPIFSGENPVMFRMMTFGSAGFRLARGYLKAIGEASQYFDKSGKRLNESWWSDEVVKSYETKKTCLSDWYSGVKTGVLTLDNGQKVEEGVKLKNPDIYATQAIIDIGALRNAYAAYTSSDVQSEEKTARQRFLPGVPAKSKDEYFFLAFAQSQCAARHDQVTYNRMKVGSSWLPEELMVNNLLVQIPEFSNVFNCPSGSQMNPGACSAIF